MWEIEKWYIVEDTDHLEFHGPFSTWQEAESYGMKSIDAFRIHTLISPEGTK